MLMNLNVFSDIIWHINNEVLLLKKALISKAKRASNIEADSDISLESLLASLGEKEHVIQQKSTVIAEQKKRHRAIAKEINDVLAPQRVKWYKQFLKDISTTGFNVNGDTKRVIAKKDLPKPPKRKDKVVF